MPEYGLTAWFNSQHGNVANIYAFKAIVKPKQVKTELITITASLLKVVKKLCSSIYRMLQYSRLILAP